MFPVSRIASGISLFVAAMALFAIMSTCISSLSEHLPSPQIVFMRNALSLLMLLPIALYHGMRAMRTARLNRHFWRAFVGLIGMELWFLALSLMPLNEATALSYISPIFATLFAVFLLNERIGIWRVLAIFTGFAGVLIILRPSTEAGMQPGAFVALGAAVMWALAGIVVKTLTATDPPWRIVTYMALFMTVLSAPLAIAYWEPLLWSHMPLLVAITVSSTLAQLSMVSAFSRAPMVVLMPFDFMRLVFTAILAYMVFGERLDIWTALGATVIVGSSVFITWRERRKLAHADERTTV